MKCTDTSWRGRIGSFHSTKSPKTPPDKEICVSYNRTVSVFIVAILLIIGGVEINPGPKTYMEVSFLDISIHLDACKKKEGSPMHENSCWGQIATTLLGSNTFSFRLFLANFYKTFPENSNEHLQNITIRQIQDAKTPTINEAPSNLRWNKSKWGLLAEKLFSVNTLVDRTYLSTIWSIGEEVTNESTGKNGEQLASKKRKGRIRNKRRYDTQRLQRKKETTTNEHEDMQINDEESIPIDPNTSIIDRLSKIYHNAIFRFHSHECQICGKLVYYDATHRFTVKFTFAMYEAFFAVNRNHPYTVDEKLIVCSRCRDTLNKNKVPAKALINGMALAPRPSEIEELSEAEVSLIRQVKPFLKVQLLNNGFGQKAMRGLVIHFPQQINEVLTQLPISPSNSDLIVVREKGDRCEHVTTLKVRPDRIYRALQWLKENNPLYRSITINPTGIQGDFQSLEIDTSQRILVPTERNGIPDFVRINENAEMLRASFCQSHAMFGANAGKQCTAKCASFLAHSFIESPENWTRHTLDNVMILGNDYYSSIKEGRGPDFRQVYLAPEDVEGDFQAFGNVTVNLAINNNSQALRFVGCAVRAEGNDFPLLKEGLQRFIDSDYIFGILVFRKYSMGLYLSGDYVYFFDSHSRGPRGGVASVGYGFVMKIRKSAAANRISFLCNSNLVPKNENLLPEEAMFTITVFTLSHVNANGEVEDSEDETSEREINSPRKKGARVEVDDSSDLELEDEGGAPPFLPSLPQFIHEINDDCLITENDPVEPELQEVLNKQLSLNREQHSPINDYSERHLEQLAFPNLYPYGVDGLHAERKIHITPFDYFQQRLMGNCKRFAGNTAYLFWAFAQTELYRIQQRIGVCGAQRTQQPNGDGVEHPGLVNPQVILSALRGTGAYWNKYRGDLICMTKTFGRPTFFLTVSHDDLNSSDCLNAIYKAKFGYDSEDINPEHLQFEVRKQFLNDYPIAAARHFSMRVSKFIALLKAESVSIFCRALLDYSVRIEFQSRGSPHAHCLLWLENPPEWNTPEGIEFLNQNVSCSLNVDYKNLVFRYQKHSHTKTCFKNEGKNCRFAFPRPLSNETKILNEDDIVRNKGRFFVLKREKGEEMVNCYHPVLLNILKCNIDIQPVTGAVGIAYYIAKYMSKSEPLEIRQAIQRAVIAIQNSALSAAKKMYRIAMTIMKHREISAQEVAFLVCRLFLRYSSRATVFLPTFRKENRVRMIRKETIAQDNPEFCTNIMDRYRGRPRHLEHLCLREFAALYSLVPRSKDDGNNDEDRHEFPPEEEVPSNTMDCILDGKKVGTIFLRKHPAVVKTPNFHPITDRDNYYYSMILQYLPFREENFCDDGKSPQEVFRDRHSDFRTNSDNSVINRDLAVEIDRAMLRLEEFNDEELSEIGLHEGFDGAYEDNENEDDIPSQTEVFIQNPVIENRTAYFAEKRKSLNPEQIKIFDQVHSALRSNTDNFRLKVLANAGAGKTYLLKLLSELIRNYISHDALIIAAPTGKAAFPIKGTTIHRAFGLPIQSGFIKAYQKLSARKLAEFRRLYANVKWIFIDEISMVSYENFRIIHLHLCEIFNTDGSLPFAGKNVVLWGDLLQLPPPKATRIFKKSSMKQHNAEVDLWRQFRFLELSTNMRQGDDPLGKIADELRIGKLSEESLKLLYTRMLYEPYDILKTKPRLAGFDDAIRICPENGQCKDFNDRKTSELLKAKVKVFTITAVDRFADGIKQGEICETKFVPQDIAKTGGIPKTLKIGIGSRVMLRRNLDTDSGLVNGATGVVTKIEWRIQKDRQILEGDLPEKIFVKFDHERAERAISCSNIEYQGKLGRILTREMPPLILAWALTVHKLQGATLQKAVVNLGSKCKTKGLAYVAISRVTKLEGLAIIEMDPRKLLSREKVVGNLLSTEKWTPADSDALLEYERLRANIGNDGLLVDESHIASDSFINALSDMTVNK